MGQLGFGEIAVIFIIALLVFGPRKLPELGKSLGDIDREVSSATKGMRDVGKEIKNSIKAPAPLPAPEPAKSPAPATEATTSPATPGSAPMDSAAETEETSSEKPS